MRHHRLDEFLLPTCEPGGVRGVEVLAPKADQIGSLSISAEVVNRVYLRRPVCDDQHIVGVCNLNNLFKRNRITLVRLNQVSNTRRIRTNSVL